jgi:hypothetical protein
MQAGDRRMAVLLGLVAMLPFVAVLGADFVWDDHPVLEANSYFELEHLAGFWLEGERSSTGMGRGSRYNPLGWTLYLMESVVSGGARPAWLYHLTSLLMHGLGTGLLAALLLVLARAGGAREPRWFAGVGAAWFAWAPVQAEVVCFAAARFDSLAWVLLCGGALIAASARGPGGQVLGGLLAASSMLSKEATLTGVVLLPILLVGLKDARLLRQPKHWLPLAGGAWGGAAAVMLARRLIGITMPGGLADAGLGRIFANLGGLMRVAVLQERLSLMRPIVTEPRALDVAIVVAMIGVGLLGLSRWRTFEGRAAAAGALWLAALLAPHAAAAVGFELMPDRYCYLAYPGLAMVVAAGGTARPMRVLLPAFAAVMLLFAARDVTQVSRWTDDIALFSWEVEQYPDAPQTHYHLGMILREEGLLDQAEASLIEAARLGPTLPQTWGELAELRANRGNVTGALAALDEGLSYLPGNAALEELRTQLTDL